uniref:Succinate:cytochrome c oxidoreductase subunit 3 n=1 Tax=Mastocarpus papillatus TaxID=31436 RepID=A0A342RZ67_9FLOR|nr:succinate:cytochrome c oxidoreductase subunit 3 [Mastocarpus papillatus]AOL58013.1 succinate:cytochrome c oxidoreductase subunit 3 [Mastocarpus papillatus]
MFKFDVLNRPLAPHLLIYVPQVSSLFSIWHRISGVVLVCLLASFLLTIKSISSLDPTQLYFPTAILLKSQWLINYVYLFSLTIFLYHSLNGIRHMVWDLTFLMNARNLFKSSSTLIFLVLLVLFSNLFSLQ